MLYPIGIGSEWWLMYKAASVTASPVVAGIYYFCLALYAPGKDSVDLDAQRPS